MSRFGSAYVVTLSLPRTRDGETASDQTAAVDPHTVDAFMLLVEQQRAADARPATVGVHDPNRRTRVVDRHHPATRLVE
jgi:hypothetical protein